MEFKSLTLEDLKRDYSNRHGFIFSGMHPSNKDGCDKVSQSLKTNGYTDVDVEFVVELNPQVFVFVYQEGCSFDSPKFYNVATHTGRMIGLWQCDTLMNFLKSH